MDESSEARIALVREVLDFAASGPLLRPARPIRGDRFQVLHDFTEAREFAFNRPLTDAEDSTDWLGLREVQASQILAPAYRDPALSSVLKQAADLLQPLTDLVSRAGPEYDEIVNDVEGDLRNCARSRAILGAGGHFFDLLWDAYRQSGWPCGWQGEYPEGVLIVYEPAIESHQGVRE